MGPFILYMTLMLIALGAIIAYGHRQRANLKVAWQAFSDAHDLRFTMSGAFGRPEINGTLRDRPVTLNINMRNRGKSNVAHSRVQTTTTRPMPDGLVIEQEDLGASLGKMLGGQDVQIGDAGLDRALRFQTRHEEVLISMFADPDLRAAAAALTAHSAHSIVRGQGISLEARGRISTGIAAFTDEALGLAAALDAARVRPWQAAAEHLGLSLIDRTQKLTLSGAHRGVAVNISVDLQADTTTITAPLSGLPAGLSIRAREGDGLHLGDPILDGVVTVRGSAPDEIRDLLRDDDLRGVLLSVVHAWPSSAVTRQQVTLVLPTTSGAALEERLEEVTTLAARLTERAAQPSQARSRRSTARDKQPT